MRRGVVDGNTLDRFSVEEAPRPGRALELGQIRCVSNALRSAAHAVVLLRGNRFSVSRRPEARRSSAPTDNSCDRTLRQADAESERSTDTPGSALEVRIQKYQIGCQDHAY